MPPFIEDSLRSTAAAWELSGPTLSFFIPPTMPADTGGIRLKSTSPLSRERSSRSTTSYLLTKFPNRLADFERYYQEVARPFQWKFTRKDLAQLLDRLTKYEAQLTRVA